MVSANDSRRSSLRKPEMSQCQQIYLYKDWLCLVLTPLLLMPLPMYYMDTEFEKPSACAYMIAIMAIYWTTEAMPIAVTALIPIVLAPLLEIVPASRLTKMYMPEPCMAFAGSIFVVLAFEMMNLHRRFALTILLRVGPQPRWLLFGFMCVCWVLSMWISNTMTATLCCPIVLSIADQLRDSATVQKKQKIKQRTSHISLLERRISTPGGQDRLLASATARRLSSVTSDRKRRSSMFTTKSKKQSIKSGEDADLVLSIMKENEDFQLKSPTIEEEYITLLDEDQDITHTEVDQIEKMLLLAVAYSSSIGGTVTIIGTAPNLIGKGVIDDAFSDKDTPSPINFFSWMAFALPSSMLMLIFAWLWLQIYFYGFGYTFGCNKIISKIYAQRAQKIRKVFEQFYSELDPVSWPQYTVIVLGSIMVILLVSRELVQDPVIGWAALAPKYTKDSTATVLVAILVFIVPAQRPRLRNENGERCGPPSKLVTWENMEKKFPFGIILLIGGGVAAAECAKVSHLSEVLACYLVSMVSSWQPIWVAFVCFTFVIWVTEVTSNTACVTLMAPIFAIMAEEMGVNPLLYVLPATVASSFAFVLPVATPPNAVVFGSGRLKIPDMARVGVVLNFIAMFVMFISTNLWGDGLFDFYELPWKLPSELNVTDVNGSVSISTLGNPKLKAVDCSVWIST